LYIPAIPNDASETENTEKDKAKGRNIGRFKSEKAIGDSNAKNFLFTQRSPKIFLQINGPDSSSIRFEEQIQKDILLSLKLEGEEFVRNKIEKSIRIFSGRAEYKSVEAEKEK